LTSGQLADRFGETNGMMFALRIFSFPGFAVIDAAAPTNFVGASLHLTPSRFLFLLLYFVAGPSLILSKAEMAKSMLRRCFLSLAMARSTFNGDLRTYNVPHRRELSIRNSVLSGFRNKLQNLGGAAPPSGTKVCLNCRRVSFPRRRIVLGFRPFFRLGIKRLIFRRMPNREGIA
jgi:hypothetical protein